MTYEQAQDIVVCSNCKKETKYKEFSVCEHCGHCPICGDLHYHPVHICKESELPSQAV